VDNRLDSRTGGDGAAACRLIVLILSLVLLATGPVFAGRCRTGVRTPGSHVVGYRKRKDLLTPAEAAKRVGTYEVMILKELQSGRLRATVIGGHYFIDPADLDAWLTNIPERAASLNAGSPRKAAEVGGKNLASLPLRKPPASVSLADVTMTAKEPEDLRPVREVADYLGVTTRTIYNWFKSGLLTEYHTPTGQRRVDMNEVRRQLKP
jgi:excisionase family DNA binding protein